MIDFDREAMERDLAALVAIPSVTQDVPQAKRALSYLLNRAQQMGMRVGFTPHGDAGYAEIGQGSVTMGVLVHVDVVGVGDRAKWLSDPFALTRRDDVWFARGVQDNKGPAIMALYAMKAVLDGGVPMRKRIRLVAGTSEEMDWTDMASYRAAFGSPDYGFSPDAGFPVYNIEKGYADMTLLFPAQGLTALSAGDAANTVPSRACIRDEAGRERVYTGVSVHSSTPEKGDNAILRLAAGEPGYAFSRFINDLFPGGGFHGEALGLDRLGDRLDGEYVGRTACAPTLLRLEKGQVRLNVNIRYRAGLTPEDLENAFLAHRAQYGYTCSLYVGSSPMLIPAEQPFIRDMNQLARQMGFPSGCAVAAGATYCGTMTNHVGWGPMPADDACAHQENEHLSIPYFYKAAALYREYLLHAAARAE